jgi:hypothetical protein
MNDITGQIKTKVKFMAPLEQVKICSESCAVKPVRKLKSFSGRIQA